MAHNLGLAVNCNEDIKKLEDKVEELIKKHGFKRIFTGSINYYGLKYREGLYELPEKGTLYFTQAEEGNCFQFSIPNEKNDIEIPHSTNARLIFIGFKKETENEIYLDFLKNLREYYKVDWEKNKPMPYFH